jgi:hypothetical protein
LLVDNLEEHVAGFAARGGQSYLFTDDATFAADLASGRLQL